MFPREHGAYGQLAFPLGAALVVAGPSLAGLLTPRATGVGRIRRKEDRAVRPQSELEVHLGVVVA